MSKFSSLVSLPYEDFSTSLSVEVSEIGILIEQSGIFLEAYDRAGGRVKFSSTSFIAQNAPEGELAQFF